MVRLIVGPCIECFHVCHTHVTHDETGTAYTCWHKFADGDAVVSYPAVLQYARVFLTQNNAPVSWGKCFGGHGMVCIVGGG